MNSNMVHRLYLIGNEVLFASLLFSFFYIINNSVIPYLTYMLVFFPALFLLLFFIQYFQEKSKWLYILIIVPYIVGIGYLLHLSFVFMLVSVILIYWRVTALNGYGLEDKVEISLFLTVIIGVFLIIIGNIRDYPYINHLFVQIFIVILYIIIGAFISKWYTEKGSKEEKWKLMKHYIVLVTGFLMGSFILSSSLKAFSWVYFSILKAGLTVIAIIFSPLFTMIENMEIKDEMPENEQVIRASYDSLPDQYVNQASNKDFDFTSIMMVIIVIGIIVGFILLFKKKALLTIVQKIPNPGFYMITEKDEGQKSISPYRWLGMQPTNRVRKEMFQLEKYAEKLKLGRRTSESLEEWLERLGITNSEGLFSTYNKVRYGKLLETEEEYQVFIREVRKIKAEWKERYSLNKKEKKDRDA